jgi:hypothetical protein
MALLTRGSNATQKAIDKAQATVAEWQDKAATARAEAAELDANAGALILADESAAEQITVKIQALERKGRAYDSAAAEAAQKLRAAHRAALEAAQAEEERLADQADQAHSAHDEAVSNLLAKLKALDGCDYVIGRSTTMTDAMQVPKSRDLYMAALKHRTRAAVIKYYLKTGKIPAQNYDLNTALGTSFSTLSHSISEADGWPPIVYEYRDAGLEFETVG